MISVISNLIHRHTAVSSCTIKDCLQKFSEEEQLDDPYRCERCKDLQPAKKRLRIYRFPKIMVLHLKRFLQDGTGGGSKLTSSVAYGKLLQVEDLVRITSDLEGTPMVFIYCVMFILILLCDNQFVIFHDILITYLYTPWIWIPTSRLHVPNELMLYCATRYIVCEHVMHHFLMDMNWWVFVVILGAWEGDTMWPMSKALKMGHGIYTTIRWYHRPKLKDTSALRTCCSTKDCACQRE